MHLMKVFTISTDYNDSVTLLKKFQETDNRNMETRSMSF